MEYLPSACRNGKGKALTVIEYVTEEVTRQGHDTKTLDGIERVGWMLNAWSFALGEFNRPTISSAILIGQLIEPRKNKPGIRKCAVQVGSVICPPASEIKSLLFNLFASRETLSPMDFYKGFQEVHPFVDGNGRTGKVLLNWLNGTLLNPVFPPADLFGHPIRNP